MLYRSIIFLTAAWLLLTAILLVSLIHLSWLNTQQMAPLQRHVSYYNALYAFYSTVVEYTPGQDRAAGDRHQLSRITLGLNDFADAAGALEPGSPEALRAIASDLAAGMTTDGDSIAAAELRTLMAASRTRLRAVLGNELAAQRALLEGLEKTSYRQWQSTLVLAGVLIFAIGLALLFFRRKVREPLDDLAYLMQLLSEKDYNLAITAGIGPLMRPVFDRYNHLVQRLQTYEKEHLQLAQRLRSELEQVTRKLIRQQRSLGRAERVVASVDLAARVAHELRNPIAAVMVSLGNLRVDLVTEDKRERADRMIRELQRVSSILSALLEEVQFEIERPADVQLETSVADVVELLRLQLDDHVTIEFSVPAALTWRTPKLGFQHALFDLLTHVALGLGPAGGTIRLTLGLRDQELSIEVVENGAEPPLRRPGHGSGAVGTVRPSPDAGPGLALVERFVHEHGGRLLRSARDDGRTVTEIRIPRGN